MLRNGSIRLPRLYIVLTRALEKRNTKTARYTMRKMMKKTRTRMRLHLVSLESKAASSSIVNRSKTAPKKKTRTAEPPKKAAEDEDEEDDVEDDAEEEDDVDDDEVQDEDVDGEDDDEETADKGAPAKSNLKNAGAVPKEKSLAEVEDDDEE